MATTKIFPIHTTLGESLDYIANPEKTDNGRLVYEEAKAYFLELMMTTEGEERERAECIYIQLTHGLSECSDVSV